jgi:hypothetical protein
MLIYLKKLLIKNKTNPEANMALHRTAIPLRSISAGELCRYLATIKN